MFTKTYQLPDTYKKYVASRYSALKTKVTILSFAFFSGICLLLTFWIKIAPEKLTWKIIINFQYWFIYRYWQKAGLFYRIEGKIPIGKAIIAPKHESMWETFALNHIIYRPCFIFRHEVLRFPIFGTYLLRMKMVCINRNKGSSSLKSMVKSCKQRIQEDRAIVIFPEGKRTDHKQRVKLKGGVYALYKALDAKVYPVSLNSGKLWAKGTFPKPGIITVKFREPIKPGLSRSAFEKILSDGIND